MFFKDYLKSVSDHLAIDFQGSRLRNQNSADIGELCEAFVQRFLKRCLSSHYRIHRGGKIVNSNNEQSPQIDIVLTNKVAPRMFRDKGVYPVETSIGAFASTSRLTLAKLKEDIDVLGKIPTAGHSFVVEDPDQDPIMNATRSMEMFESFSLWTDNIPLPCVFAFDGTINSSWVAKLNDMIQPEVNERLFPDLVIVNKRGMIVKLPRQLRPRFNGSRFIFDAYGANGEYHEPFSLLIYWLYELHKLQEKYVPALDSYFRNDVSIKWKWMF